MRSLIALAFLAVAGIAYGRTIVETEIGPQVTVTVKRLDDASWSGRIRYQTFSADGRLVADEEVEVGNIVNPTDRATVVEILNRTWLSLHNELSIPTPTPTP